MRISGHWRLFKVTHPKDSPPGWLFIVGIMWLSFKATKEWLGRLFPIVALLKSLSVFFKPLLQARLYNSGACFFSSFPQVCRDISLQ